MARTVAKKSGRKAPIKSGRKVAAKAAAKPKAAAKKEAAKPKAEAKKATRAPRLAAADGQLVERPVTLTATQRAEALASKLEHEDRIDISAVAPYVITDYAELRATAIRAMGGAIDTASEEDLVLVEGVSVVKDSFATRALGEAQVENIIKQRKASSAVFNVHPLDFHPRWLENGAYTGYNTRDFTLPERIRHVAEMAIDVGNNGIRKPAGAFIRGKFLGGMGGETRFRGTMLAWILKSHGIIFKAPESFPILLSRRGQNDGDIALDVVNDNRQNPLKPLEIAEAVRNANRMGKEVGEIAKYMNQTTGWVKSRIAIMEMPEKVLNMVRDGTITVGFAKTAWDGAGNDPSKTIKDIEFALRKAKAQGSSRVMPKHLEGSNDNDGADNGTEDGEQGDGETSTRTKTGRNGNATIRNLMDTIDVVSEVLSNCEVEDRGDGRFNYVVTREQIIEILKPRLGVPIPEGVYSSEEKEFVAEADAGKSDEPESETETENQTGDETESDGEIEERASAEG